MKKDFKKIKWVSIATVTALSLLIGGAQLVRAYLVEQSEQMAYELAQEILPAILVNDHEQVASLLKALESNPAVERVELISAEGAPLASLARVDGHLSDQTLDFQLASAADRTEQMQVIAPITFDSLILANLHIAVNMWPLYMRVMAWLGAFLMVPSFLYVAVKQLKIKVRFEHSSQTHQGKAFDLQQALKESMAASDISVEYQPVHRLSDGHLYGVDLVVAWAHPSGQTLHMSVAEFMEWVKKTNICLPVESWVLKTAFEQMASLQKQFGPIVVLFNLSIEQLSDPEFLSLIQKICLETGFPYQLVELVVSEKLLLERDDMQQILDGYLERGSPLVIEGVGLHRRSLETISQLRTGKVKLDQRLLANAKADVEIDKLIHELIEHSQRCGIDVMAVGMSTSEEIELATDWGCALGQGRAYSLPLSDINLRTYLAKLETGSQNTEASLPLDLARSGIVSGT
jgi:EAL domain-containing protein (putative c-di-GMP-specific phosphodiesterase class I)